MPMLPLIQIERKYSGMLVEKRAMPRDQSRRTEICQHHRLVARNAAYRMMSHLLIAPNVTDRITCRRTRIGAASSIDFF